MAGDGDEGVVYWCRIASVMRLMVNEEILVTEE